MLNRKSKPHAGQFIWLGIGVFHIFVARRPTVDRLTQQRRHAVLNVGASGRIEQLACAGVDQLDRVIEITAGE